jgi:hypothetical protein
MYDHDNIISWQLNSEISVERRREPCWAIRVRFLALNGGDTFKQVVMMQIGQKVSFRAEGCVSFRYTAGPVSRCSRCIPQRQVISILKVDHRSPIYGRVSDTSLWPFATSLEHFHEVPSPGGCFTQSDGGLQPSRLSDTLPNSCGPWCGERRTQAVP